MKIELTHSEATDLLARHLGDQVFKVPMTITITAEPPRLDLLDALASFRNNPDTPKIYAINALRKDASRQGVILGLATAKQMVELFPQYASTAEPQPE